MSATQEEISQFVDAARAREDLTGLYLVTARVVPGQRAEPLAKVPLAPETAAATAAEVAQDDRDPHVRAELRATYQTAPTEALPL